MGTAFDPMFPLRRELHWEVETSASAISHLAIADADTTLGTNANFVHGGNPICLRPPLEDNTEVESAQETT